MDAFDTLIQGPWRERGLLLIPAAYRTVTRRPAGLSYLKTRITYSELFGVVVWSRNSCGCLMVELQQSPETLAAPDRTGRAGLFSRKEEEIAFALMISLGVEMLNIGAQRGP